MSFRSASRLCLAMVFLVAQLSLSWAGAMPDSDGNACGHAAHEMGVSADCMAGDGGADDSADDSHQHGNHADDDCAGDCQLCALALLAFERPAAMAPVSPEPDFREQVLPPGTASHPFRPPATS